MLRRKLTALDHPNPNEFDVNDETEYRSTVLWLEDQKIRHYKIEDRGSLRQIDDQEWAKAFEVFLKDLNCPVSNESPVEQLTWLASYAVRLEYADNAEKYNAAISERKSKQASTPNIVSKNPLDNLDFTSADFATGVGTLASVACVGPHLDPKVRLGAVAIVLENSPHPAPQSKHSETVETPSDVLNLIFINEIRNLQTSINEALVAVQRITADPRTDTSLGKVGF